MKSILIKDVVLNGNKTNILIQDNRFSSIDAPGDYPADEIIAADGYAILPPFYNTHSHSPMALLRGYADDLPLNRWLEEHIWPFEKQMTEDDIYRGAVLAIREMIKSGCIFFSDMYFGLGAIVKAAKETGVRAEIGVTYMDGNATAQKDICDKWLEGYEDPDGLVRINAAPHSIYTCNRELLIESFRQARLHGRKIQLHVCETLKEIEDCMKAHGMTPVEYLDSLGLLGEDLILAHCVHVSDNDIRLLARHKVSVAHCPCSNMKLGSGIFRYRDMIDAGVRICLGTDGASSNNCLDMGMEMKFAALLSKVGGDLETVTAGRVFEWATRNGAEFFGIDAGVIEPGRLADCVLVSLQEERMQPLHNLVSNYVYSADSSVIDTVICNGRILMRHRNLLV